MARTVEAIASIRSAGGPSFSPDGARIAFISSASGIPQVWTMAADGSDARQVTRLSDPVQSVDWSPHGDLLAYDVAPGGGLNVQIYVSRPDGSPGPSSLILAGGALPSKRKAPFRGPSCYRS